MKTKEQLLASLEAIKAQLAALGSDVSEVYAALPQPVVVEPPPPPPPPARPNLYVQGDKLFRKDGVELPEFASIEVMISGTSSLSRIQSVVNTVKELGATAIGPLPQGSPTIQFLKDLLRVTREANLICLFNADHCGGSGFLKRPDVAAVLNAADHVILQAEVELANDGSMSDDAWLSQAIDFVKNLSSVYPDKPLRVGLPNGGRNISPALKFAKRVVDTCAHKGGLLFAPQMYWSITGNWYQSLAGLPRGFDGTLAALKAIAAQDGVYMFAGTDETDDVGRTNQAQILDESDKQNTSVQVWALSGDGMGNNLVGDITRPSTITSVGVAVRDQLKDFPRIVL
jgi:hypothetical protein